LFGEFFNPLCRLSFQHPLIQCLNVAIAVNVEKTVFPSNTLKKIILLNHTMNDRQWITRELNHPNFLSDLDFIFNNRSSQYDSLFTVSSDISSVNTRNWFLFALLIIFPFDFWLLDDVHRRLFVQCHKFKLDFCSVPFKHLSSNSHCGVQRQSLLACWISNSVVFRFFDPSPLI
jgi:hypothetical protein